MEGNGIVFSESLYLSNIKIPAFIWKDCEKRTHTHTHTHTQKLNQNNGLLWVEIINQDLRKLRMSATQISKCIRSLYPEGIQRRRPRRALLPCHHPSRQNTFVALSSFHPRLSSLFRSRTSPGNFQRFVAFYRVSIKSFLDYKHLLQENYVEYKYISSHLYFPAGALNLITF
jgi:hypothetical protein